MNWLNEFFRGDYMPHGHCYLWRPSILWTNVVSDLLIALAYFSIPVILVVFIHLRKDVKFRAVFVLFAAFILLCGITHLFSIYTIWNGTYGLHGVSKALTAIVSVITAISLVLLRKSILSIPTLSALERAVKNAEEANRAKSEFLACMSHEIRTPINGVMGMLGLAIKNEKDAIQKRKLITAQDSANSLLAVVNDILDFSKVEAGKLDIENVRFSLPQLIRDVGNSFVFAAREKGLDLVVDITQVDREHVIGDPNRIRQILVNLIGNALKFTPQGVISIVGRLRHEAGKQSRLEFEVRDTGIGISPEKMPKLFASFTQIDAATTRVYGGTGLGLAICQRLVHLMGGEISVESHISRGSVFSFDVCVQVPDNSVSPYAVAHEPKTVLLLDANSVTRQLLESYMHLADYQVISCDRWEEVDSLLMSYDSPIECVLVDRECVNQACGEVIARYREKSKHTLTLWCLDYDSENHFFPAGNTLTGVIAKPVAPKELLLALRQSGEAVENETHTSASTQSQAIDRSCVKVLVVEDNSINQTVIEGMLEDLHVHFEFANHGGEAIRILQSCADDTPFHLIFMDCQMPVMDGYEATRRIRDGESGEDYSHIEIVAMTANAMSGDKERCFDAGMTGYITKPVDPEKVRSTIDKLVVEKNLKPDRVAVKKEKSASQKEIIFPAVMQYLDPDKLPASIYRKPARLVVLLEKFLERNKTFNKEMLNMLEEKDMSAIKSQSHAMKGVSGNLGMDLLFKASSDLEASIANGSEPNVEHVGHLLGIYNNTVTEVRSLLNLNRHLAENHD